VYLCLYSAAVPSPEGEAVLLLDLLWEAVRFVEQADRAEAALGQQEQHKHNWDVVGECVVERVVYRVPGAGG
jgi:hypothetical protein